jgi:hypothetical protein
MLNSLHWVCVAVSPLLRCLHLLARNDLRG